MEAVEQPLSLYPARTTPVALSAASQRVWLVVAAGGGASLLVYALLLLVIRGLQTAEPSYVGQVLRWVPLLTRETLDKQPGQAAVRYLALLVALFGLYGLTLRAVAGCRSRRLEALVFALGAAFLVLQIFQPAMLSTDVYAYTLYGRIFAIYHGDPYLQVQGQYADDPYMPLTYFLPWPSWYGPLWTLLSAGVALLVGERVGLAVLLFRGLAVGAALTAGGLIWASLRRLSPDRAAQGLVFFLWNPLVVLESGMSGHNDALLAALLLGGVGLALRGRKVLPVVLFTLSALVKLATGLILPLYVLMLVREALRRRAREQAYPRPTWEGALAHALASAPSSLSNAQRGWPGKRDLPLLELARLVASCGLAAGLTAGALFGLARTSPLLPVMASASAAYFYDNNVYQVVFPALRTFLGEDPASARVPVHFYPWWGLAERAANVVAAPRAGAERVERVAEGALLLVIAPEDERWARVYDPDSGRRGFVREEQLVKTPRPDERADTDPTLGRLERNPATGPIAARANDLIRAAVWLAFGLLYLLAAWRTTDLRSFLNWSTIVFLAAYWLIATEIWPWYAIWALALGALAPTRRPALLAAILSAGVLTLYVTIGFERSAQSWLFTYRSLPAFVLPLVLFAALSMQQSALCWVRSRQRRQ